MNLSLMDGLAIAYIFHSAAYCSCTAVLSNQVIYENG